MAKLEGRMRERSRAMRHDATKAERSLWRVLRSHALLGWKFRRQHPIPPYVADFACITARLVVEVDGGQHAESLSDTVRDRRLAEMGWRTLRFWNHEVLQNADGVLTAILAALEERQQ